jgi:hypothetical protein
MWSNRTALVLIFGFAVLAIFIALMADVSILLARRANLRRAVETTAVAVAGQVYGGTDTQSASLTAANLMEVQGFDPQNVLVETCETDIARWQESNPSVSVPPDTPISAAMPPTELCNWDNPQKLIRLSAQVRSETLFLRLIGVDHFTLTAQGLSQAEVFDVVLVLDTSPSMAADTSLQDFLDAGMRHVSPASNGDGTNSIMANCFSPDASGNYDWGGCCNDPGGNAFVYQDADGRWLPYTDSNLNGQYDGETENGIQDNRVDGNYADLLCQPFRQIRDSARGFIETLDFIGGDRLGLVTFNRNAQVIYPNGDPSQPPLMASPEVAVRALTSQVGIYPNPTGERRGCIAQEIAVQEAEARVGVPLSSADSTSLPSNLRPFSYETIAQCADSNPGEGIRAAMEMLTDPASMRQDSIRVIIILSDGPATASRQLAESRAFGGDNFGEIPRYGDFGFCPWYTFCHDRAADDPLHGLGEDGLAAWYEEYDFPGDDPRDGVLNEFEIFRGWGEAGSPWLSVEGVSPDTLPQPSYEECSISRINADPAALNVRRGSELVCNDGQPDLRHFCLDWSGAVPQGLPNDCSASGRYDADDYARDMADLAGLIEVAPGIPGHFIALMAVGFGDGVGDDPVAAALLRYIADSGDNGIIDNNLQRDWRDDGFLEYGFDAAPYPSDWGGNDPCSGRVFEADPTRWCGHYFFAQDEAELGTVFAAIRVRLNAIGTGQR